MVWAATVLAGVTAISYLLIGWEVLGVGDLTAEETPAGITYVAAAAYLVGGLLILLRRRWLWIVGAVLNALVIVFFYAGYADRPSVMSSAGGVVTKAAEVLLEVCLVYLIVMQNRAVEAAAVHRSLTRVT